MKPEQVSNMIDLGYATRTGDLVFTNDLDEDEELEVWLGGTKGFINPLEAMDIIHHLKIMFELNLTEI